MQRLVLVTYTSKSGTLGRLSNILNVKEEDIVLWSSNCRLHQSLLKRFSTIKPKKVKTIKHKMSVINDTFKIRKIIMSKKII